MPFYICDIRDCHLPSLRQGCTICDRHLCATHMKPDSHVCSNTDDASRFDTFRKATERDIAALLSRVNVKAMQARASSLRSGVPCTIPTPSFTGETCWDLMGGMNYHVPILFEDGVVWLCRIRRRNACSPPPELQNRILLSEAATLRYLSAISIPVPKVYDVAVDSPSNPVGVGYMLMQKLPGKTLEWYHLDQAGKHKVLEQLAYIFAELDKHTFPTIGCLQDDGKVGPLVNSNAADVDAAGHLQMLGPFSTPLDFKLALATHQCQIIGNREAYMVKAHAVDAYLVHHYLLDYIRLICPWSKGTNSTYYLKHMDDKGDHILVDADFNITGIIDWEWAQTTSKAEAFAAPIFLLDIRAYFNGKNELSDDEQLFASILESQGSCDIASCVRKGRIQHQLAFCIGGDYDSESFQNLFSGLRSALGVASDDDPKVDWKLWKNEALVKYQHDLTLQALLSDV